jgi:hypothetical protein
MSVDKFSYVEPGSVLPIAMRYNVQPPEAPHDSISFSLTIIAAFSKTSISPEDIGPFKRVTFPFIEVPLPEK